jgi:uncharacterized membrane protein
MVSLAKIGQWVKDRKIILLLSFIVAVGIFLRIYELGTESLWLDEADSLYSAHQSIIQLLKDCAVWHRHPPLHFFMLYLWIPVFGNSEVAVRLPSVIFGIISIVLIYKIGRHLFNEKVGLISSFLSAISYYHIYYSQETRSYSLLLFLTLLSFLFFIKLISSDSTPKSA